MKLVEVKARIRGWLQEPEKEFAPSLEKVDQNTRAQVEFVGTFDDGQTCVLVKDVPVAAVQTAVAEETTDPAKSLLESAGLTANDFLTARSQMEAAIAAAQAAELAAAEQRRQAETLRASLEPLFSWVTTTALK